MNKTTITTAIRWKLAEAAPGRFLAQFPEYPKPIAQLLYNRGLRTDAAISNFLNPVYTEDLHDPTLLGGMADAVRTIRSAIEREASIVIHGDYDADGITATALLYDLLRRLGARVTTFLPNRYVDGYGVSAATLQQLHGEGAELVITVDCGISSAKAIAGARRDGLQVVVTDHHTPPSALPHAEAVINPNLPGDRYPNKALTGVGVAFKLAQQLLRTSDLSVREQESAEKWLLDLVAIGTIADVASLTGENRTLVKFGLVVLGKRRRLGLHELIKVAAIKKLDASCVGFAIAPRLNAAGRLTDAERALSLLTSRSQSEAAALARELNELNVQRQAVTAEAVGQAKAQLGEITQDDRIIILDGHWLSGIVGLVAGRLTQEYSRPSLIIERGERVSRGSARSIPALNIVEALAAHKEYLGAYGGHAGAAGFSLPTERLEDFRHALQEYSRTALSVEDLAKELPIEATLTSSDLNFELVSLLDQFEPFGIDNKKPQFLLRSVEVAEAATVGQDGRHLKLKIHLGNRPLTALAFGMAERIIEFRRGSKVDLAGCPVTNTFNNTKSLEWHVSDVRPGR